MELTTATNTWSFAKRIPRHSALQWFIVLLAGAVTPLGFAPFHLPGVAILSIAILYRQLQGARVQRSFWQGGLFGLGYMAVGVSWVSISIHAYGHMHYPAALGITTVLLLYLALFSALCSSAYSYLAQRQAPLLNALLFSSLWCCTEYLRANCLTGFPWLLLGFGQIDTPLQYLLPLLGVYGLSFMGVFAATVLSNSLQQRRFQCYWLLAFVLILLVPNLCKSVSWMDKKTTTVPPPLSVAIIQGNLAMRDKWDEHLFWKIVAHYQTEITKRIGQAQIIVLPESAIPLPAEYVPEFLEKIDSDAQKGDSAIIVGIPQALNSEAIYFYNTMHALGHAQGTYRKQHLVPFGEYIPPGIAGIMASLELPLATLVSGASSQALIEVHHIPVATLICYELAYPNLLRAQLPTARWIISVSDDGWFGKSLAIYQHLQMAQALSIASNRYQIVANNDGLSSLIDNHGNIIRSLPAFTAGTLEGEVTPLQGATPWVRLGDKPLLGLCFLIAGLGVFKKFKPTVKALLVTIE